MRLEGFPPPPNIMHPSAFDEFKRQLRSGQLFILGKVHTTSVKKVKIEKKQVKIEKKRQPLRLKIEVFED